jgi:hypothetical protein
MSLILLSIEPGTLRDSFLSSQDTRALRLFPGAE